MNTLLFDITVKQSSHNQIFNHLLECSEYFNPPLNSYVNLDSYSLKIFTHAITFEAWADSRLIGLIAAYFNNIKLKDGYITNISIVQDLQGMGIATILLKKTLDYGKKKGFREISLEVNKCNKKAIDFYCRHGFLIIQEKLDNLLMNIAL